eukprot:scaffold584_cov338-Pavlova_lutheri.AAC.34
MQQRQWKRLMDGAPDSCKRRFVRSITAVLDLCDSLSVRAFEETDVRPVPCRIPPHLRRRGDLVMNVVESWVEASCVGLLPIERAVVSTPTLFASFDG